MSVQTDNNQLVTFNVNEYSYFDHGYAVTTQKVQGQEAQSVFSADTRKLVNYNSLYVGASRVREDLHIYTNDKQKFTQQAQVEQRKTSTLDFTQVQPIQQRQQQRELSMELSLSNG